MLTASFAALLFQNHLDRDSSLEFRGFVQLSWVSAVHYVTCWVKGNGNICIALNISCFTRFHKILTQAFLHNFASFSHLCEITNHRNHDSCFISLNIRHLFEDENQTKWSWYGMMTSQSECFCHSPCHSSKIWWFSGFEHNIGLVVYFL